MKCFRVENKFCPNKKLLRLIEIYCPIRPLPHVSGIFLKTDIFFLRFRRSASPHVEYSQSFSPVHTKTLRRWKYLRKYYRILNRACVTSVFVCPFVNEKLPVLKSLHSGVRFWKDAFLVIVFTRCCAQIPTALSQYCRDIWLELKLCWLPPLAVNIILVWTNMIVYSQVLRMTLSAWSQHPLNRFFVNVSRVLWLIVSFRSWDCLVPERIVRC